MAALSSVSSATMTSSACVALQVHLMPESCAGKRRLASSRGTARRSGVGTASTTLMPSHHWAVREVAQSAAKVPLPATSTLRKPLPDLNCRC